MKRALIVATALAVVACAQTSSSDPVYHLSEFTVSGPDLVTAGAGVVGVTNEGEYPHTLVITGEDGEVMAASELIQPGASAYLDVDLSDGVYYFTCRIVTETPTGEIIDHYEQGMSRTVEVSG